MKENLLLDFESKDLYHVFDDYGMAIVNGDNRSWRDSLGRNILMWIAYKDSRLERGIENCLRFENNEYILYRHPKVIFEEGYKNDISRDHWSYFIIYRKLKYSDEDFNNFIKDVKVKFGLRSWVGALKGKVMPSLWYFLTQIMGCWLGNKWNKYIRKLAGVGDEYSNEDWNTVGLALIRNMCFRVKMFRWMLIPTYPIHNKAWQIYVLPPSFLKDKLKEVLLQRIKDRNGNSNYLLRILYGDNTVTEEEVNNYEHMTGYRWGTNCDVTTKRDVKKVPKDKVVKNGYEKDLLVYAFTHKN